MIKNTHRNFRRIFRMRDGPPANTGPPDNGVIDDEMNTTGPPVEWLVMKQTRARE